MIDSYETRRTIEEVLDLETGEIINTASFFEQPENVIVLYRRRLEEAIQGYTAPKFVCPYCKQLLKLSGKSTRRGQVSFFAHQYDSEECEIKTDNKLSKEEIETLKYSNIKESERHIRLKEMIYEALTDDGSLEMGVKNVEQEKRVKSTISNLNWRQPDISAEYNGHKIVFELQLSTTFLSVIVERDIFYRLNKIFIVWVFNFSDNQEFVNIGNLMCKDIYYSNKRNAFIFDEKAQKLSADRGELIFNCIWFEPFVENGVFNINKSIKKSEYIGLSDLKFDENSYKPFYVDADRLFKDHQPNLFIKRDLAEIHIREKISKSIKISEKFQSTVGKLKSNEAVLKPIEKGGKWGYESEGIIIVEPIFSEVTEFENNNFAKVKRNKKFGFIDKTGVLVIDCVYLEASNVIKNYSVFRNNNGWYLLDITNNLSKLISCDTISRLGLSDYYKITHKSVSKVFAGVNRGGYNTYRNRNDYSYDLMLYNGEIIFNNCNYIADDDSRVLIIHRNNKVILYSNEGRNIFPYSFDSIRYPYKNEPYIVEKDGFFGGVNLDGEVIIPFIYDSFNRFEDGLAHAEIRGKSGIIDVKGEVVVPFEYKSISNFNYGVAIASINDDNNKYGVINKQGSVLIPIEYNRIVIDNYENILVENDNIWGCYDLNGNLIIPIEYQEIRRIEDGNFLVIKDNSEGFLNSLGAVITKNKEEIFENIFKGIRFEKWGIEDKDGKVLIPFEYSFIENLNNEFLIAKKENLYGIIDLNNNTIIPFEYLEIDSFENGLIKARTNQVINNNIKIDVWGILDVRGNEMLSFNYNSIESFDNKIAIIEKIIDVTPNQSWYGYKITSKFGVINLKGDIVIPIIYENIGDFVEGKAWVLYNDKWGYFDDNGNQLIDFEIDSYSNFISGYAQVIKNGKPGIIDEEGVEIIENSTEINKEIFKGIKFTKWGIENSKKETIVPFIYDQISEINDDRYIIRLGNKWGALDENYKFVIDLNFESIGKFNDGKAIAKLFGKYGLIDTFGNSIIQFDYDLMSNFNNEISVVKKGLKWGAINLNGEIIIPIEYDKNFQFVNGIASVVKNGISGLIDVENTPMIKKPRNINDELVKGTKFSKFGVQNLKGNTIIPFEFDQISEINNNIVIVLKNKLYGLYSISGTKITECIYESIEEFIDGRSICKFNSKYGVITDNNEIIIPFEYENIVNSNNSSFIVTKNNVNSVINYFGEKIETSNFEIIGKFKNNYALVIKNGKYGVVDSTYDIIIDSQYEQIKILENSTFKVCLKNYWGIIDKNNKILIPIKFKEISSYIDGVARVKKFGTWEKVDSTGIIKSERKIELSPNVFLSTKFKKYGLEDQNGKVLIPFKYDIIIPYGKRKAICYINDKFKIEYNDAFTSIAYKCKVNGSSTFGIFLEIPEFEREPLYINQYESIQKQKLKIKGLLHISEIEKNNMKIDDFRIGNYYELYIQFANVSNQRLSFSLTPNSDQK